MTKLMKRLLLGAIIAITGCSGATDDAFVDSASAVTESTLNCGAKDADEDDADDLEDGEPGEDGEDGDDLDDLEETLTADDLVEVPEDDTPATLQGIKVNGVKVTPKACKKAKTCKAGTKKCKKAKKKCKKAKKKLKKAKKAAKAAKCNP